MTNFPKIISAQVKSVPQSSKKHVSNTSVQEGLFLKIVNSRTYGYQRHQSNVFVKLVYALKNWVEGSFDEARECINKIKSLSFSKTSKNGYLLLILPWLEMKQSKLAVTETRYLVERGKKMSKMFCDFNVNSVDSIQNSEQFC